jgi:DNA-binding transcriptional ArsR family regulator
MFMLLFILFNISEGDIMSKKYESVEKCENYVIHREAVNRVRAKMPLEESLYDLAELFKVFGDTTRIKILWALDEEEMCVCDIAALLNMTQSAISHQLRILKNARLVKYRREGKIVYYSLDDDHVRQIFDQGLIHINEEQQSV